MLDSQPQIIQQTSQCASISACFEDLPARSVAANIGGGGGGPVLDEDDVARGLFVVVGFYFQGG